MDEPNEFFVAGGTLRSRNQSYVTRPADEELYERTLAGEFCYVLTARQMGKSSLMIRTQARLKAAGVATAVVDLTQFGSEFEKADAWYLGLLTTIVRELRFDLGVNEWWAARGTIGPSQRLIEFLRTVVLAQIAGPIAIFIDEIDTTLKFNFRDDFFAAIRAIYNARASEPAYERLSFVLLGVATPTDLIQDRSRTPFNIGRRIVLEEFRFDDAAPLLDGLETTHPGHGKVLLERIFDWTNGHPYLTQKLCLAAAQATPREWNSKAVNTLVEQAFLSHEGRKDSNLQFVQARIRESPWRERRRMLQLYGRVLSGVDVPDDDRSPIQNQLELTGLVAVKDDRLRLQNQIYERVFDKSWVKENTPTDTDRLVAFTAVLITIVITLVTLYQIFNPQAQADLRANTHIERFRTATSETIQVDALGRLFELGFYKEARELYFELDLGEQSYLFLSADAASLGSRMVIVVQGLAPALDTEQMPNDSQVMDAMIVALDRANQPRTELLIEQLQQWKVGRALIDRGSDATTLQQAIDAYTTALEASDTLENPALLYDRAMAYVGLEQYEQVLADLDAMVAIAQSAPFTPTPLPTTDAEATTAAAQTAEVLEQTALLMPTSSAETLDELFLTRSAGATQTAAVLPSAQATPTTGPEIIPTRLRFLNREEIEQTVRETIRDNQGLQGAVGSYSRLSQLLSVLPPLTTQVTFTPTIINTPTRTPVITEVPSTSSREPSTPSLVPMTPSPTDTLTPPPTDTPLISTDIPTITASSTPTIMPILLEVPDVRGAPVDAVSQYLQELGFRTARTQLTRAVDVEHLCDGMVSYTSPPAGSLAEQNSLIRIFYRGFNDGLPLPADCPPS